ncbi:two-component sensor histidine kinase [bacterium]|nr:two-component sensor histidine kinase [bacterium]
MLVGEAHFWAVLIVSMLIIAFALAYFAGTADLEFQALREAKAVADQQDLDLRLRSERAFRSALIEAFPQPALYIDASGKVEASNSAARVHFNFIGADPLLSAVVRRPELLAAVDAARSRGEAQMFEFVERDETDSYFACMAAPVVTTASVGVLLTMLDLTEIRRGEFARADFLANASHELRTPLTSLSGFIETMRGPARDDQASWDRFLEIMQGQTERMRRLINDLLSLSRIELNEHRPPDTEADLAAVVAEVKEALAPVAEDRKVSLYVSGPASGVGVRGVKDELFQVAQNLIDNAIKYSSPGGVVEIEIVGGLERDAAASRAGRRWEGAGRMSIATAAARVSGRFAVLRVTDAGPGIDRQHLPRLAERFYRVDPGRGLRRGTGLGLAIVKHVVNRHRGEFLVESEVGRGSAFGVILPVAGATLGALAAAIDAQSPPTGG